MTIKKGEEKCSECTKEKLWCKKCGRFIEVSVISKVKICPLCKTRSIVSADRLKREPVPLKTPKKKFTPPSNEKQKRLKRHDNISYEIPNIESGTIEVKIIEFTESTEQYPTVVATDNIETQTTRRQGQDIVRELTLENYGYQCALCDVSDEQLLVVSHISRWADDHEARGNLSNVICLCKFHDSLFEDGYLSLSDDYKVLKNQVVQAKLSIYY
ncbi:MAG: hypothetical protein HC875_24125 [Anaerolineales bacterium]|nr:hypothetical protein [Anaerolineales bacterium]